MGRRWAEVYAAVHPLLQPVLAAQEASYRMVALGSYFGYRAGSTPREQRLVQRLSHPRGPLWWGRGMECRPMLSQAPRPPHPPVGGGF